MSVIQGVLEPFSLPETEGIIWSVYDPSYNDAGGKRTLPGVTTLEKGDLLTVFNQDRTETLWEGVIDFDYEISKEPLPLVPSYRRQAINDISVHGIQKDIAPQTWLDLFVNEYPCTLTRRP